MEIIKIGTNRYRFFGKIKGANSNKFNRVAKLAYMFNELEEKLYGIVERGNYISEHARCALSLLLMMQTGIRVGNEGSAEGYMTAPHPHSKKEPEFVKTYGLTTLLMAHLMKGRGGCWHINFVGKKQVANSFTIRGKLASVLREFHIERKINNDLWNNSLLLNITDYQLTKFIKKYVGKQFSPKDFRTLRANIEAWNMYKVINQRPLPERKSDLNAEVKEIALHVSGCLNNTPGVCKKSYIDDGLFEYHFTNRWSK